MEEKPRIKQSKHHDNRPVNWHVSMTEEEAAMAEERRARTGLTKAEFGRQALTTGNVISRINEKDRKALSSLSHMRADIDRLIHICEKHGVKKALNSMLKIEDQFADIYNNLLSKIG